jgi:hypothetical protein
MVREKKLISDKMSMSFSLSVREINSIKQTCDQGKTITRFVCIGEREIQSNREGESDSEENRDESDVDSNGEIDRESECEQSEDETFRNGNKFVEIEYEMEYN